MTGARVQDPDGASREAFWFGARDARVFGMLHVPARPSGHGVVMCNSVGYEGLVAGRALRKVADDATRRGFHVLRFDYDGTGDSAGGPWEPNTVAAWLASIDAAVAVLRARGCAEIHLVGVRLGATLACRHASDRGGIASLALWNAATNGAGFIRELRALARFSAAARPAQHVGPTRYPDDSMEVVGFEFTAATQAELASLDARVPIAADVLVLDADGTAPNDDLVAALTGSGSTVQHERLAGWDAFMVEDETKSVMPTAMTERISAWLAERGAPLAELVSDAAPPLTSGHLLVTEPSADHVLPAGPPGQDVEEEPIWIGDIFAVVTRPAPGNRTRRVAIVLCNTGAVNHVGPGRLHVTAARYWAGKGFTTVRVDLSGVGDGPGYEDARPYEAERTAEVISVVDEVRRRLVDIDQVVLFGICSGAYHSFHACLEGADVTQAILVNPAIFYLGVDDTVATSVSKAVMSANSVRQALFSRRRRVALRRSPRHLPTSLRRASIGFGYLVAESVGRALRHLGFDVAAREAIGRDLALIGASGVQLTAIFASNESGLTYLRTFGGASLRSLERSGSVVIAEVDGGDHIFSPPGARQRLFELVTRHLGVPPDHEERAKEAASGRV